MASKLMWPIGKLTNWPENPRGIKKKEFGKLKASLKEEGQLMPLLVDTREGKNNQVLGGNMTLRALKANNEKEVWVELKEPRDDAHAFGLALKHNMGYGYYEEDPLNELVYKYRNGINLEDYAVDLGKFTYLDDLDVGFDDIKSTENRERQFKDITVTCPYCQKQFEIKV